MDLTGYVDNVLILIVTFFPLKKSTFSPGNKDKIIINLRWFKFPVVLFI